MALHGLDNRAATHADCANWWDSPPPEREPCKAGGPVPAPVEKPADRNLPHFWKADDFDGMMPAEFCQFGAFAATVTETAAATRKTVDFVARALEGARSQSA